MSVFLIGLKIQVTPPVTLPAPHQASPAHMVTPYPVEGFRLRVGMFQIVYEKMFIGFITKTADLDMLFPSHICGYDSPVVKLPGRLAGSRIVFDMLYVPAPFQNQCF
jgi:hypothetical protein